MASKTLIAEALRLYKKLGGNTSKILGTRSNVNFLGKGDSPESMLEMSINPEALGIVKKDTVLPEFDSAMGYLTSGKLNDMQASRLVENLRTVDSFYNPPPGPANITDLATGTRDLDAEGIASLRRRKNLMDEVDIEQGLYDLDELNFTKNARAAKKAIDEIELPEGVDRADTILPTGAGLEAVKSVKNFEKRVADELVDKVYNMAGVSDNAKPVVRGNARDFLNTIKDLEDPTNKSGPTLSGVMERDDFRFMTEGGGGAMGDPLLLVQKYFGPRVAASVAQLKNRDEIELFARRLVRIKDGRGRSITDRDFNPDDVDLNTVDVDLDFADGGPVREGYMAGALVRGARMGYQALRKYGFEAKDISKMFRDLAMDKSLQGKEKTLYFKTLNKALKNPDEFPDTIKEMQIRLGIDVGTGFKRGGLASILEV